jgi:hypothetical protein
MRLNAIHHCFSLGAAVTAALILIFTWHSDSIAIIKASDSDNWFHSDLTHRFGRSVSKIGDFNNDGQDDFIVGATGIDYRNCAAYIFYGPDPSEPPISREIWYDDANVILEGPYSNYPGGTLFGHSVDGGGDFNGDDIPDVIVGAPSAGAEGNTHEGCAYIFFGNNEHSREDPLLTIDSIDADVTFCGDEQSIQFGWSVAFVGKLNDDDLDDVVVGDPQIETPSGPFRGHGRINGFLGFNPFGTKPMITADSADFSKDRIGATQGSFGFAVSGIGDFDGDGLDNFIVGDPSFMYGGQASIYEGQSEGIHLIGVIRGGQTMSRFGESVAAAGDVNDDGYDDVIVGAPNMNERVGNQNVGYAYIILGRPTSDLFSIRMWDPDRPLVFPRGVIQLQGQSAYDYFGHSVGTVGDYNGDLYDDVIVGAPRLIDSGVGPRPGGAYVFGGRAIDYFSFITLYSGPDQLWLAGENLNGRFGSSVAGGLNWTADGNVNALVGEPNNNSVYLFNSTQCFIPQQHRGCPVSFQNNTDKLSNDSPIFRRTFDQGTIGFYFVEPGGNNEQKLEFWGKVPVIINAPTGKSATLSVPWPTCDQSAAKMMLCKQPSHKATIFWTFETNANGHKIYAFPDGTQYPQEPQSPPIIPLANGCAIENNNQLYAFGNNIELVGNAKVFNLMPAVAGVRINPKVINLKGKGGSIKCTVDLPDGFKERDIESDSLLLSAPSCNECQPIKSFHGYGNKRRYTAFFAREDLVSLIESKQGEHTTLLRLSGHMKFGNFFEGVSAIRVKHNQK